MFKLLNRLFGGRGKALRAAPVPVRSQVSPTPSSSPSSSSSANSATDAVDAAVRAATARQPLNRSAAPEELCGLTPGMTPEEIRDHLAMLYKRHNRAASSLEADLREEAEIMLDAVVRCRETFLGVPAVPPPATAQSADAASS
jgi:hypothetical protein